LLGQGCVVATALLGLGERTLCGGRQNFWVRRHLDDRITSSYPPGEPAHT
jgi:hypothetical protein